MKRKDIDDALEVAEEIEGPLTRLVQAVRRWVSRIKKRRAARKAKP